jgi:hypothetical protein
MDGESGYTQERPLDLDKLGFERAVLVCDHNTACERQIAVQPRVPDPSTI